MKKCIFIAAALVALAACSKVTPTEEPAQPITFNVINYANSTKAYPDNPSAFPTTKTFGSYAWVTATDWATDGQATVFFSNKEVSYKTADNVWSTATAYFWPKQAKLTFASYAPYMADASAPTFTKDANALTGKWALAAFEIPSTTDTDLMFADLASDKSANVRTYGFEGVPTLFHHALTKVNFSFALAEDASAFENISDVYVVVNKASIVNIKKAGAYSDATDPKWTPGDATAEYTFVTADKELKTKDAYVDADVTDRILLPQALAASTENAAGQQLKISYTIYTKYVGSNDYLTEPIVDELYDLTTQTAGAWTPNMAILYKVKIYPTEQKPIYFDPAIALWDPTTESTIEVNKPE